MLVSIFCAAFYSNKDVVMLAFYHSTRVNTGLSSLFFRRVLSLRNAKDNFVPFRCLVVVLRCVIYVGGDDLVAGLFVLNRASILCPSFIISTFYLILLPSYRSPPFFFPLTPPFISI